MPFCEGVHRPPIIRKLHHKPHHSMFSADPAQCPCIANGQPVVSDGFLADDPAKGNTAGKGPIIAGLDNNGSKVYYPANYGSSCEAWDQVTDPECKKKLPPAYCNTRWCFVDPQCQKPDTQKTWRFPGSELYYSYEACGSFDSYSSYKCLDHDSEEDCVADLKGDAYRNKGPRCEWNLATNSAVTEDVCQPERCKCNGDFLSLMSADDKEELYGTKCSAWDQKKCEEWQHEPGAKMGVWCCQSWCYVDASCPSAQPSSNKPGLYYSYVACKDNLKDLQQCPWPAVIGWQGSPALLSDKARCALGSPKTPKKKSRSWSEWWNKLLNDDKTLLWIGVPIACGVFVAVIAILLCCCCKSNPSPEVM